VSSSLKLSLRGKVFLERKVVMNRINAVASWILGQLGVALLLISIVLVPQNRVLAAGTSGIGLNCDTGSCGSAACITWKELHDECPGTCGAAGALCQCAAANCVDCLCAQGQIKTDPCACFASE
jgi:hypothetical protein